MSWSTVKIGQTCLPIQMREPRKNPDKSFMYVDISSIDRRFKVITSTPEMLGADAPSRARKEIREGDVLVSTVRPNLNTVVLVPPELDGQIASTGFCVLRPKRTAIEGKYLFYFTTTPDFINVLSNKVRGAHYPAVSDGDVKEIELPLPPISEQRRIVDILDQTDHLRRLRADADAKAQRILAALFIKMFGDPATNPKGWPTGCLGDLTIDLRYGTSVRCHTEAFGLPVLRIPNVIGCHIDLNDLKYADLPDSDVQKLTLEDGDILLVRTNGNRDYVGRCAVFELDGDFLFASYLIRARLDKTKVEPKFIATSLVTPMGRQAMSPFIRTTAGQSNISQEGLNQIPLILPPIEIQRRFCNIIEDLENVEKQRILEGGNIENLFCALLHRAFTGDLTASWRKAHMKELLQEMERQSSYLEPMK